MDAVISMFTDEVIRDSTTNGTGSTTREHCSELLLSIIIPGL